ncbi:DUF3160 domain-containing protein [Patescibacteria group bacterium]|nr:MAG: DUF3160 domain-containing protein [Patescibacteria group bacterium]
MNNGPIDWKSKLLVVLAGVPVIVLVFLIGFWGVGFFLDKTKQAVAPDNQQIAGSPAGVPNVRQRFSFPAYQYQKSSYNPSIPSAAIATGELGNLNSFENAQTWQFSAVQKESLDKRNFFITKNQDDFFGLDSNESSSRVDDWSELYGKIGGSSLPTERKPENSVFVTSDYLLHVYHRLLEKEFEYIEQREFYPRISKMSTALMDAAVAGASAATDNAKKESYQRLAAYFAVPSALLDTASRSFQDENFSDNQDDAKEAVIASLEKFKDKLPATSYDLAKQELELVMKGTDMTSSPIFGDLQLQALNGMAYKEDYTQFTPRSHYAKNPILRTYFRSMMWYGRQNLLVKSPELTRDAMNITLLVKQLNLMKDWEDIYAPTAFFVGESDDLGIYEYQKIIEANPGVTPGEALVKKIQEESKEVGNPQIMSSAVVGESVASTSKSELQQQMKGFRFMGQRFTPDAFVFSTLTQGQETADSETGETLPSMPTALMVMATMGNKTADPLVDQWVAANAPDSKRIIAKRMTSLKQYFQAVPESVWTQNIYWGWLHTLRALFQEDSSKVGYPGFMQQSDWNTKNLQGALGSWTELKHDTLLYAKQSYAEMGGGGPDEAEIPPVPKGYVEPNIEFFDRLIPLAKMTHEGLKERGLLDSLFDGRSTYLLESLEHLRKIAIAELENKNISDEDFEWLRLAPGNLESVMAVLPGEDQTEDSARSALIADVHTDVPDNQILYEANGIPNYIFVAVKDTNGTRLTKGLTYSYFEFANPLGKRLTDQDWRGWVYGIEAGKMPAAPTWTTPLMK